MAGCTAMAHSLHSENARQGAHNSTISPDRKIAYLPIYMLMFIEQKKTEDDMIYKLDLSALQ